MKKQIKTGQICAIFIALLPLTKVVCAPSYFAKNCGEKLWQPLIILLLLDLLLLLTCYFIYKKHDNKSFYEILISVYGKPFANGIFILYAIFFFAKTVVPLFEQKIFIENTFYETLPQAPVFYPALIIIFYLALKGLKTFGRTCQIASFITAIGFLLIIFLGIPSADYESLLPLFAFSNKSAPICALTALTYFNDAICLLFFLGSFKAEKKSEFKIFLSYLIPFLCVILFYVTFYGIFDYVALSRKVAISEVGIFSVALINVGRFDHIALFLLALSSIIAVSLPITLSTHCLVQIFGENNRLTISLVLTLMLFGVCVTLSAKYLMVFEFISKYFAPLFVLCGYLLPLLGLGGSNNELQTG
ncbi:MAG: GerAB/ArcD/ProY family transporter [Clostridia bacterium]|nr:GerAB/ArcD/ProY family transporter [Clostridia bacterium]